MSRNYDNWERLVAAVVKREQIWQLCHQDSISTIYSSDLEFDLPISLGNFDFTHTFELVQQLNLRKTVLVRVLQDVQCFASGSRAVVKLMDTATEDEFEQHMIVLKSCEHQNVATPSAYHFSETTKLMVYDYYTQGSLFDMFQGNTSRPDWERRVRIAVGAARGIAHIHAQCGGKLVHGNIKSSNVFVNSQGYGCVSDIGWGMPSKRNLLEYYPSQESDVFSFGMLLLELVTGRSLTESHYIVNRIRLSSPDILDFNVFCLLVDEVDMEERYLHTFPFVDSDLDSKSVEEELRKTLMVAQRCLVELPENRLAMSQVVLRLEQLSCQGPFSIITSDKKRLWNKIFRYRR